MFHLHSIPVAGDESFRQGQTSHDTASVQEAGFHCYPASNRRARPKRRGKAREDGSGRDRQQGHPYTYRGHALIS